MVFPIRAAYTEQVTAVWVPYTWLVTDETRTTVYEIVMQSCLEMTLSRPSVFSLYEGLLKLLPTSALGKVSRVKMRALVESGTFTAD